MPDISWQIEAIKSAVQQAMMDVSETARSLNPAYGSHSEMPTLRDQFAMAALGSMDLLDVESGWLCGPPHEVARRCYEVADAMLKARATECGAEGCEQEKK